MSVASLARQLTLLESDGASNDSEKRAYVALRHVHLPKLEENGVVSVDTERNVVEPVSDGLERIEPALSLATQEDLPDVEH